MQPQIINQLQPILLIVCAVGILIAIIVPPLWLFIHRPTPRMQYRLIVMEVFFALSAIMSLLFGLDAEITSNVPFAVRIGGPFAGFLGGVIIFLYFKDYKEEPITLANMDVLRQLETAVEFSEERSGWSGYRDWISTLDGFGEIKGREQEHFIRNVLGTSYDPNVGVKHVHSVAITTAFLYLSKSVVKLQRIRGESSETPSLMRFRSHSSYGSSSVKSIIVIAEEPKIQSVRGAHSTLDPDISDGYARIDTKKFDCLILTLYAEYPEQEDYMLVNVSRFSGKNEATVSFALVSTQKTLSAPHLTNVRRAFMASDGRVPLVFRSCTDQPSPGWGTVQSEIQPWLRLLDDFQTQNREPERVRSVLNDIRRSMTESVIGDSLNSGLLSFQKAMAEINKITEKPDRSKAYEFRVRSFRDNLLALFAWKQG